MEKTGKREEWELEHWGEEAETEVEADLDQSRNHLKAAQSAWTDACLFWYDIWQESHPEQTESHETAEKNILTVDRTTCRHRAET